MGTPKSLSLHLSTIHTLIPFFFCFFLPHSPHARYIGVRVCWGNWTNVGTGQRPSLSSVGRSFGQLSKCNFNPHLFQVAASFPTYVLARLPDGYGDKIITFAAKFRLGVRGGRSHRRALIARAAAAVGAKKFSPVLRQGKNAPCEIYVVGLNEVAIEGD